MNKKVNLGLLYLLLPMTFFLFINFSREYDIWFLISHGRYILSNGFPHTEILTMHTSFKFVMQQPFFSITMYLLYKYLGSIGVITFVGIINTLILFILYKLCMLLSSNNKYFSFLIAAVIDSILEIYFIIPRPHIVSLLLFVCIIYILEKFIRGNNKIIYILPVISIILVNMHASMWIMMFVLYMPYIVELSINYIKNKDKKIIKLIIIMMISFIVGFINPYGYEAMFYSLTSYGNKMINEIVNEMHGFTLTEGFTRDSQNYLLAVLFILQLIMIIKNRKKYSIHSILLFLGLSFMAFLNCRSISLYLVCSLPFIIISIKHRIDAEINIKVVLIYIMILVLIFIKNYIRNEYKLTDKKMVGIVKYLDKNYDKKIRIYNIYDDGPYLEYKGYKPYIDTRAEVFLKKNNKKEDIFEEYYKIRTCKIDYEKVINKYNFDVYVVDKDSYMYIYLKNKGYKQIYHDKYRYLFRKK